MNLSGMLPIKPQSQGSPPARPLPCHSPLLLSHPLYNSQFGFAWQSLEQAGAFRFLAGLSTVGQNHTWYEVLPVALKEVTFS